MFVVFQWAVLVQSKKHIEQGVSKLDTSSKDSREMKYILVN